MADSLIMSKIETLCFLIYRIGLVSCMGGLMLGYDTAIVADAIRYLRDEFPELGSSEILKAIFVCGGVAGTTLGAWCGKWINDKFGRRRTIMEACILMSFGYTLTGWASCLWLLIVGRIVSGVGMGIASTATRAYIAEISLPRFKEMFLNLNILSILGGLTCEYYTKFPKRTIDGRNPQHWAFLFPMQLALLSQCLNVLVLPESPRWLYRQDKQVDIDAKLEDLYPSIYYHEEVQALKSSIKTELLEEDYFPDDSQTGLRSIFQQLGCMIHYIPAMLQVYGLTSKSVAVALSLGICVFRVLGSYAFRDRSDHKVQEDSCNLLV